MALLWTAITLSCATAFVAGGGARPARATAVRAGATATAREPVLTLYRDTNGWCPFCERVWIALEKKGVAYDEKLINLQDKPDWYKELVPTTLVPAIEWHTDAYDGTPGSGRLIWESKDILQALDAEFDAAPLRATEDVAAVADVLNASFGFVYARNLTSAEQAAKRETFSAALDALDGMLRAGGPFVRGAALSAADLELAPTMERFYYQLPVLKPDFPRLDSWPGVKAWFAAMEAEPAFARRVQGDAYSWTAVTSSFLRFFAADDDETKAKIARADAAAADVLRESLADVTSLQDAAGVAEAVAALERNRAAVARDAADKEPKTQPHVQRCAELSSADAAIDAVLGKLRGDGEAAALSDDGKAAAAAIAARLCAPRDMGAPAARALRHALLVLAE